MIVAAAAACGLLAGPAGAQGGQGLTTGFSSDPVFYAGSSASRSLWADRAAAEGATIVRENVIWAWVAPKIRPRGFVASDPNSPGYDWTAYDRTIRNLSAHGLTVAITILDAPRWAEGANRPAAALPGTWRPDPGALASFATAVARRYSGTFPDPQQPGVALPRVRYYQAWNEPNLGWYLTPQWTRTGRRYKPASPEIYRALLNRFYASVKSVSPANKVLAAGTAPYGDPPGTGPPQYARMAPVQFDRYLFCLSPSLKRTSCAGPVHLDGLDHHPYEILPPTHAALGKDNVAVPDLWKVVRVLRAGLASGTVLPHARQPVWVTELDWDTNPPSRNRAAYSQSMQARFVSQALYLLWRQGVSVVLWQQISDYGPMPGWTSVFRWGGMFFHSGGAKLSATSFRFPFAATRRNAREVQVWGRAPRAGTLEISSLVAGRWRVLKRMRVGAAQVFTARLRIQGRSQLRAAVDGDVSLPWAQGG